MADAENKLIVSPETLAAYEKALLGPRTCWFCGGTIIGRDRHVRAPENKRGIKCLVLISLEEPCPTK